LIHRRPAPSITIRVTLSLLKRSAALSNGDEVSTRVAPTDIRVSSVELFFDLVFVFAITQLTTLLAQDPTIIGLVRIVLIFGNIWWMYGGYARLTNAVPPRRLPSGS
jgi:low temperature requirement protein LtrA